MHSTIAQLLAEYIEHVVVEFSDVDNHTKHAMTLSLFRGVGYRQQYIANKLWDIHL